MKDIMKIAVVNFTANWGNKESNLKRIEEYAEAAGAQGVNLLVIPETALTGYDNEPEKELSEKMHIKLAETIPGPSTLKVAEIAKKYHMYVIFGMVECLPKDPLTCFNAAAIISPDGTCSSYRKMHLPFFLRETAWAKRGDTPGLIETEWGPIGICICWETYLYPEMLRYYRAKGARLVVNITATPAWPAPIRAAETVPTHCFIYSMYIASADLCGLSKETKFLGGSGVIGPNVNGNDAYVYIGKKAGDPDSDNEEMYIGTINLDIADKYNPFPVCDFCEPIDSAHWRPDLYSKWFGEFKV